MTIIKDLLVSLLKHMLHMSEIIPFKGCIVGKGMIKSFQVWFGYNKIIDIIVYNVIYGLLRSNIFWHIKMGSSYDLLAGKDAK